MVANVKMLRAPKILDYNKHIHTDLNHSSSEISRNNYFLVAIVNASIELCPSCLYEDESLVEKRLIIAIFGTITAALVATTLDMNFAKLFICSLSKIKK